MPKKQYPSNPSLAHFKHQAKDLLKAARQGAPEALQRIQEFHPRFKDETAAKTASYALSDAQFVIAREYDFASWGKLRECMDAVESYKCAPHKDIPEKASPTPSDIADEFLRLSCLTYGSDHPSRWEKARQLWADHPEIRKANIHIAAASGDLETARALLAENPKLARSRGGPYLWEPLLYAAYSRFDSSDPGFSSLEVARQLLQHGADPNAGYLWEGFYLFTALTGVFGEGEAGPVNQPRHQQWEEFSHLLLKAGANPNDVQALYNRMFTKGATHLELLLSYGLGKPHKGPWPKRMGGKLDSPEKILSDQLHWAAEHDHFDRVKLLVNHGVDMEKTCRGKTPYEAALLGGNTEIASFLLDHGAKKIALDPIEAFSAACLSANRVEAATLIENDAGLLEKMGPRQSQLLGTAAGSHRLEAIQLMIDLGFSVNTLGRNTALHEAAWAGDLEMIDLLIKLGADTTIRDRAYNATPLQWAEYNHQQKAAEHLRLLETPPASDT